MVTRRNVMCAAVGMVPFAQCLKAVDSTIRGVRVGIQSASFSFSGFELDEIINTMVRLGLDHVDMMSEHVENYLGGPVDLPGAGRSLPGRRTAGESRGPRSPTPEQMAAMRARRNSPEALQRRNDLRKWRLSVPLDEFGAVQKKFKDAGLEFFSYNFSFQDDFTDEEIDRGFLMAKALGTQIITVSSPASVLPRVAPFAEKHDTIVAVHNHSRVGDNEIATPESFENAMGISEQIWANLDVGHFFAAGFDPISFIKQHRKRITNIHLKDRKKDNGPAVEWGEGDTPLRGILLLLRDDKYGIPVEIEHVGPDGPEAEIDRCFQFCKEVLTQ